MVLPALNKSGSEFDRLLSRKSLPVSTTVSLSVVIAPVLQGSRLKMASAFSLSPGVPCGACSPSSPPRLEPKWLRLTLFSFSSGCKGSYDPSQAKPAAPAGKQMSESGPTPATRCNVVPAPQHPNTSIHTIFSPSLSLSPGLSL